MSTTFGYIFPAIRGIQATREYYVAMCPLHVIPKIFLFDEEELAPEVRAQRILNKGRIPELSKYIVENKNDYVFSAITASIDGEVEFEPINPEAKYTSLNGVLKISMNARFIINDGQHRRAAIEQALKSEPDLGDESIAVVFFLDKGLERSQQMFSDLNRHAVKPSRSLGLLYEHRNDEAKVAKLIAINSKAFSGLIEMERSSLSERSRKLFTLSAIATACSSLLEKIETKDFKETHQKCEDYWNAIAEQFADWENVRQTRLLSAEVRRDKIHSHAIILQCLGIIGSQLLTEFPKDWKSKLPKLKTIDWSRNNHKIWEGRAMIGGRVQKTTGSITLTTNYIKSILGLKLSESEKKLEQAYEKGQS
jgi:DNA sulfur modification protein DndB